MPFIGKQPQTGAYSKLDAITTSATATYNLTLDGSAYYPQSANHLMVSLNGVMQAPQDSFTISGSQITFASALTSSDNIDFIMALGDTLDIGVPSAGSVNTSQLANSAVTDAKMASTLDLSGKTVTYGLTSLDMPAGSVLQVQYSTPTGVGTTSTSTSYIDDGVEISITPISSSSILYVTCFSGCSVSGGYAYFKIVESVSGTMLTEAPWGNFSSSPQQLNSFTLSGFYTPGNTTSRTFKLQGRATAGTRYLNYNVNPNIVVMEIAA